MTLQTVPVELFRQIGQSLFVRDGIALRATCMQFQKLGAFCFARDSTGCSRLFSNLVSHKQWALLAQKLGEMQQCSIHMDELQLHITSWDKKFLSFLKKIDLVFTQVHIRCELGLDDVALDALLGRCANLTSIDLGECTAVSLERQIETHFPTRLQDIKGLFLRHDPTIVYCAAKGTEPVTWISLFLCGRSLMQMKSEEHEVEGRQYLEKVLKVAPRFIPAMKLLEQSYRITAPYDDKRADELLAAL